MAESSKWVMKAADRRELDLLQKKAETLRPEEVRRLAALEAQAVLIDAMEDYERTKSVPGLVTRLLGELAAHRAGQYAMRYALEQRIERLEARQGNLRGEKPRVRVPAGRRPE